MIILISITARANLVDVGEQVPFPCDRPLGKYVIIQQKCLDALSTEIRFVYELPYKSFINLNVLCSYLKDSTVRFKLY
jgi:hypothetical protein